MRLRNLLDASVPQFTKPLLGLARAHVAQFTDAPGNYDTARHIAKLAEVIAETRTIAELLGRERLLQQLGRAEVPGIRPRDYRDKFADGAVPMVDQPSFAPAVRAILQRTPALVRSWHQIAAVQAQNGIAFAHAASAAITRQVQESLAGALAVGQGRDYFTDLVRLVTPWTDSYAETVYRTNLSSAYTAGQFEQAQDPDVADVFAGLRFSATNDSNTRPNHAACDGLVARVDDPVWNLLRPPLGFNCRCDLIAYTRAQAAREGRLRGGILPWASVPAGAHPDHGFNPNY